MSLAEDLLNSLSDEELAVYLADRSIEPHIVINPDRTVTVPDDLKHIAVKGDHNIETVTFDCPRYWDGHDLSEMQLRIVFQRPDGHREPHPVENLRVDADDESVIHFDWTISGNVTAVQGNISFTVCGKLSNAEGVREREWHTRLNQDLIVDEGMDCSGEEIVEQNPDIIEAILVQLDELKNTGGVSDEQIANALTAYLEEHPIEAGVSEQEVRNIITAYLEENPPEGGAVSNEQIANAIDAYFGENPIEIPTIPNALPNPKKLIFKGGATGEYDGSTEMTINIPTGGDGGMSIDTTLTESGMAADAKVVGDALKEKQPKGNYLTEAQLKTINGQSLVGTGDIEISGSGEVEAQQAYVPVKYLENTGTQYIDTGYVLQEDDVLEVDYEIPEAALSIKTDKILIDARDSANGVRVSTYSGTYKWYARFGHNESKTSTAITSSMKGSLSISKGQFVLNGTVVFNDMVFTAMPTGTLKFFAGVNYETGMISAPSYARILGAKIRRNGETIRNYRTMQRTEDGELGMRETVTSEFLTNAGTGTFGFAPADVVESSTVVRKPTLTEEQKLALQSLMDDYYNNRGTFYYEFTHNRNAFTAGSQCYNSEKGKFKQCCATFVQHIMMGRSVSDFVGKTASTYSPNITRTPVSDFGYYFDFKYRKYLYGLTDTDENGNPVYYGYNQPNADNFEGSYSYNSYYHPDSTRANKQNFNGFCNANDMARELYEMGCEIPFSELDIGDIIFTLDNDLSDNSSMLNFHAWRNIYHVGMVYDVKQIDASSKEIYYIECTSYFDVDNRPIEKPFLSSAQMDLRFKAFKLTEDMAFCARMPAAFGYAPNVPSKIAASATP